MLQRPPSIRGCDRISCEFDKRMMPLPVSPSYELVYNPIKAYRTNIYHKPTIFFKLFSQLSGPLNHSGCLCQKIDDQTGQTFISYCFYPKFSHCQDMNVPNLLIFPVDAQFPVRSPCSLDKLGELGCVKLNIKGLKDMFCNSKPYSFATRLWV